jgi:hypothetical protein
VETCPIRAALLASRDAVASVLEHWSLETAMGRTELLLCS